MYEYTTKINNDIYLSWIFDCQSCEDNTVLKMYGNDARGSDLVLVF